MVITVKRSGIARCEKVFEYSMPVEEAAETVVPDTMPDAAGILFACGTALLRGKDVQEGSVSVSGAVKAIVLYTPEGAEGIRSVETEIAVNAQFDAPGATAESLVTASLSLSSVDAKLLNPRKILVRCVVNVCAACYEAGETYISTGLEGEDAGRVETLTEPVTLCPVVCVKEKTFVVSDEYRLQPGLLPIGELLWHRAELVPGTVRNVGSRIVFSGSIRLDALYRAEGSEELCSASFESEYSQMLDTDAELNSPDCAVCSMLTAEYIEPIAFTGGERGISAEYHIVSQCVCSDSVHGEYLADCYSNACGLQVARSNVETGCSRRRSTQRAAVSEVLDASPGPVSVIKAFCRAGTAEYEEGAVRCPLAVTALYLASDGMVYSVSRRLPVRAEFQPAEGERIESAAARCCECSSNIVQGGIELRAAVDFEVESACAERFSQIESVECVECDSAHERPSVVVIRAKEGDTLWLLGKRYHSTAAIIAGQNGLEGGEKLAGRVLLIPRAHN